MKRYLTEFIGTFFLVAVICLTAGNFLAPIAIGSLLIAIIYMGYPVSGAHYNPATTLAILILRKISLKEFLLYLLVQLAAGCAGALVYFFVWGRNSGIPRPNAEINILKPLFLETIFTFIMILVILYVAASKRTAGNNYYGLAIGVVVTGISITGAEISGGAFNPAVGFGPMLIDALLGTCSCNPFEYGWIYFAGPLTGSALAACTFRFLSPEDIGNHQTHN
ncbi:MAG: porin [Bacteroidetes bacterium]|nr:MAG: porin [Bacteroidota bacterium]